MASQLAFMMIEYIRRNSISRYGATRGEIGWILEDNQGMVAIADAIDSLWQRLNSDFGFVSQLNDKIRENDRAQKQIVRLLDGLALIDFDELIELVGSDGSLRKLLISQLQNRLSHHYTSLREVQRRLIELMARFRKQQARSRLMTGMAAFMRGPRSAIIFT
mgnify:CR=1 FL=1